MYLKKNLVYIIISLFMSLCFPYVLCLSWNIFCKRGEQETFNLEHRGKIFGQYID